jgi:hypothetical protein
MRADILGCGRWLMSDNIVCRQPFGLVGLLAARNLVESEIRRRVTGLPKVGGEPPADLDGFRAFARSLPTQGITDIVETCEPIGDGVRFTYPAGHRRHWERLDRRLDGLVVIGDAVCSLHPIDGQGMSSAAAHEALDLPNLPPTVVSTILPRDRPRPSPRWSRAPRAVPRPAGSATPLHWPSRRTRRCARPRAHGTNVRLALSQVTTVRVGPVAGPGQISSRAASSSHRSR